jgi:hypothetical protein
MKRITYEVLDPPSGNVGMVLEDIVGRTQRIWLFGKELTATQHQRAGGIGNYVVQAIKTADIPEHWYDWRKLRPLDFLAPLPAESASTGSVAGRWLCGPRGWGVGV